MTLLKHRTCPTCTCNKKPLVSSDEAVANKAMVDRILDQLKGKANDKQILVQVGLLRSLIARIQLDRKN